MDKILTGIIASPGIGIGKVFVFKEEKIEIIKKSYLSVAEEKERLLFGRNVAKKQLEEIREKALKKLGEDKASIFDGHITLLEDEELFTEINEKITSEDVTAEFAVDEAIEEYSAMLANLEDEYFRERATDLKDIGKRWIYAIAKVEIPDLSKLEKGTVILARELTPSDTSQIDLENVYSFVTEIGGKTAHSAIMARSLELPAIVGVEGILKEAKNNQVIIVDGLEGKIILDPSEDTLKKYEEKKANFFSENEKLKELKNQEAISKDGKKVDVWGNIGSPKDVNGVLKNGGFGIGLYRTEFLFMDKESFPTEDEQFEAYKEVVVAMKNQPVTIRTMDIGGDKSLPYMELPKEENPFLGWRAIRICLEKTEILRTQFKAILRASNFGHVKVMLPMVIDINEIRKSRKIFEECKEELRRNSVAFDENIALGIMVETPAVAIRASYFAKEVDFFSIGTNDLIQYVLASDRGNQKIKDLYDPYNPAVLQAIKMAIDGAHSEKIKISMCGEFAGDENAVPLLLGMGLDSFSMSGIAIPKFKSIISQLDSNKCEELVEKVLKSSTPDEVKEELKKF
ncbi:MAG: phosphoenolpyruvate--protein phosphotransferase [Fusobacteriales bacterium]|nr:MAG: phosphoenolpyruvate--protein phosphotransferase [Fusobacteriales bacterium]